MGHLVLVLGIEGLVVGAGGGPVLGGLGISSIAELRIAPAEGVAIGRVGGAGPVPVEGLYIAVGVGAGCIGGGVGRVGGRGVGLGCIGDKGG